MIRNLFGTLLMFAAAVSSVSAQQLMPRGLADSLGLEESWIHAIRAPAGLQSIVDQRLFVHESNPDQYVEVVAVPKGAPAEGDAASADKQEPEVLARIAVDDASGNRYSVDRAEAERRANNEIRRLKRRGIQATINYRTVPRVRLYSLSTNGTLECRDAETGRTIWAGRVGESHLTYGGLGVSENYVMVLNSGRLIQVDAATGDSLAMRRTAGTSFLGSTCAGDFAMVPMMLGHTVCYSLSDFEREPFRIGVTGTATSLPVKSPSSAKIAWGTQRGYVYSFDLSHKEPLIMFRYETVGTVSGALAAASGDRFFFATDQGKVYGIRATRLGTLLWTEPTGEPILNAPVIAGDQVLVTTSYGRLISMSILDGSYSWDRNAENVGEVLGVLGDQIFARSMAGALTVLDLRTGQRVGTFPNVQPERAITNPLTNRLYLVSTGGTVQCLREQSARLPTFLESPDVEATDSEQDEGKQRRDPQPMPGDPSDPFANEDDPFAGDMEDDPFGADPETDPFGADTTEDDPFGADEGDSSDNPFDNAEDPFDL